MNPSSGESDTKVAVLVDCENADPDILDYALRVAAQFGRVVLRRGFGSHTSLANKWQTVLVQQAFTPCLQYAYAAGKNTSDIALAMDAIEALFDQRATTFCLVTSDSDFAGLCRKLRERGATVHVIGEAKTPEALRNASDQFFQWVPPEPSTQSQVAPQTAKCASKAKAATQDSGCGRQATRRGIPRRADPRRRSGLVPAANRPILFSTNLWTYRAGEHAQDL